MVINKLEQEKHFGAPSRVILYFSISEPLFEQQGLHFVSEQVQSTQQMYVFVFCPQIIFKFAGGTEKVKHVYNNLTTYRQIHANCFPHATLS